jgi:Fic family protein
MVNIHPFRDGNGRMCRLILNVILMKYAGIVVTLGEKGENRDAYLAIASESSKVGGHHGQLASMILHQSERAVKRLRNTLKQQIRKSIRSP